MAEPLILGDTQDFHSSWFDTGVFHIADTTDNEISPDGVSQGCRKFDGNLIYFNNDLTVLSGVVEQADNILFTAEGTEICCYSNGCLGMENGQILNPQFETLHKFSDTPCYIDYNPETERLMACSMSGELAVFKEDKLEHEIRMPTMTRGQIVFSTICPRCCYAGAYLVTYGGVRMLTEPETIVYELKYRGVRRAEGSSRIVGMNDNSIEFFDLTPKGPRVVAKSDFSDIRVIDCIALDKHQHFDCCLIYENLEDSFKYARYLRVECKLQAETKVTVAKPNTEKAELERPEPEEKLDILDTSGDFSSDELQQPQKSFEISELTKEEVDHSSVDISRQSTQYHISESRYFVQQFFTYNENEEVISSFRNPSEKQKCIEISPVTVFSANQYGMIVGAPAGEEYQITVKAGTVPMALSFHRICLHADLSEDCFCLLLEDHLLLEKHSERQPRFRAIFSVALTGNLIKLIDDQTVAATFQHGPNMQILTVYKCGVPIFNRSSCCYTHLASSPGILFAIREDNKLDVFDVFSLKTVYSGTFDIGRIIFFQLAGASCFAASENGIFEFDFEDSFSSSVGVAPIYSFLEHTITQLSQVEGQILRVMEKSSKEAVTRSDLDRMRAFFKYVVYCEEADGIVEFECLDVEESGLRLDDTRDLLLRVSKGEELSATYDGVEEFAKDISDLRQRFPSEIQPQYDLSQHPEYVKLEPNAPINMGDESTNELDTIERKFALDFLRLRSSYALADSDECLVRADVAFDLSLIEYAKILAEHQMELKMASLPWMCRTRNAVEGLRSICMQAGLLEPAEVCLLLSEEVFADSQFARESSILPTLQIGAAGVFARRMDDLGFSFLSGDARNRFDELGKELRAKVEDYIRQAQNAKVKPVREPQSVPASPEYAKEPVPHGTTTRSKVHELPDYSALPPPKPDANRLFMAGLSKSKTAPSKVQPAPTSAKASQQSGSPMKQQLSMGDALGLE